MENLECPRCHEKSITAASKWFLGPGRATTCPKCQAKISVPTSALWVAAVFIAGAILSMYIPGTFGFVVLVAFFVLGCWLHYKFVPLIAK
jgi:uncharacterized paraquat-inducible protein A